jgi:hypothetical protein
MKDKWLIVILAWSLTPVFGVGIACGLKFLFEMSIADLVKGSVFSAMLGMVLFMFASCFAEKKVKKDER